jgi:hypothetical protein
MQKNIQQLVNRGLTGMFGEEDQCFCVGAGEGIIDYVGPPERPVHLRCQKGRSIQLTFVSCFGGQGLQRLIPNHLKDGLGDGSTGFWKKREQVELEP